MNHTPILASASNQWIFWIIGVVVFIIGEIIREIIVKVIHKALRQKSRVNDGEVSCLSLSRR